MMLRAVVLVVGLMQMGWAQPKGKNFSMNCCNVENAPAWLTKDMIEKAAFEVQQGLGGWSYRKFKVKYFDNQAEYDREGNFGFPTRAFFRAGGKGGEQMVALSPKLNAETFRGTFGHELVHVIFFQKYHGSIPIWLEEGFANNIGAGTKVNYKDFKSSVGSLPDVTQLSHPKTATSGFRMAYQLSSAAVELIESRCNKNTLLMLSVGRDLSEKLKTFCKIKDINTDLRDFIKSKV